jgi:predicted GNAT family acetyltransferase
MSWKQASKKDLPGIITLILRDEACSVPFSARLRAQARGYTLYVNTEAQGEIRECFLFSLYGLLLPVFPGAGNDEGKLGLLLRSLRPAVHSIMGVAPWVEKAESLLPLFPTTRIEYYLMALSKGDYHPPPVLPADVRVRRADLADATALFPLQKSYEHEEVIIDPALFSDIQCMKSLKRSLSEELVFFAEKDGKPVSKAGTNARGFGVDQIGGVFTVTEERGKGLAAAVMEQLLAAIFTEKSRVCLFVKKKNDKAIALYERLGFTIVSDYLISYYGV